MKKIIIGDFLNLDFAESQMIKLEVEYNQEYSFDIKIILALYFESSFYALRFKNAEIKLSNIRGTISSVYLNDDNNLEIKYFGNQDFTIVYLLNNDLYKSNFEIYKLTEEESKQYYYV